MPLERIVSVLVKGGYRGHYGLEWEKAWHPEIEEPEVAFAEYVKRMRSYLASAGYKA